MPIRLVADGMRKIAVTKQADLLVGCRNKFGMTGVEVGDADPPGGGRHEEDRRY